MKIHDPFKSRFTYPTWVWILIGVTIYFFTKELYGVSDFRIFYLASSDFLDGTNVYESYYGNGFKYLYSPLFAMLMSPFTYFDVQVVGWFWKLLNILMIYKIWSLSMEYFNVKVFSKTQMRWFSLLAFFFGISLIYKNIHNHQMTIFLLWGVLQSMKWMRNGKWVYASVLIAFIINIKVLPIVLIPYLIYRAEWKVLSGVVVFFVLFLFLPSIVVGYEHNLELHKSWWTLLNPSNQEHLIDVSERNLSSLTTFVPVFLMDSAQWDENYTFQRNFLSLSIDTTVLIMQIFRGIVVLLVLNFLGKPFKRENNKLKQFWELGYLLVATVLIFPHQQDYAFLLMWPLLIYLAYYMILSGRSSKTKKWYFMLTIFIILALCINSGFWFGDFRKLWAYIKLITWGVLLFLPFYFMITPDKVQKINAKIS